MATTYLDRSAAIGRTKTARLAALALGTAAVLVAVIGLPGIRLPQQKPLEISTGDAALPTTEPTVARPNVNVGAMAERFAMVNNRPVVPTSEAPVIDAGKPVEPPPPPPPAEVARFLGVVDMMKTKMALISRDDKQSFVKVGDKIGEHTVHQITAEHMILMAGGEHTTINITPKGEDMVTHATSAAAATNPFGNAANARQRQPQNPNAAVINAQLAARGAKGNARAVTQPQMNNNNNNSFPYAHIMADPQRRQRFTELQAKLRNTGEYKSSMELDEAAAKMTDEEFGPAQTKGAK